MSKTLGGALFIWNGISQDYCFREAIYCLLDLCDEVSILYGGTDGTEEAVESVVTNCLRMGQDIYLTTIDQEIWDLHKGRTKLSHFTNEAIRRLKTDFVFMLQADEIVYPRSFQVIRDAIQHDVGGYVCKRYNAWRDPLSMLNVAQERKPCSTEVIRLAKRGALAYDDSEHLAVNDLHVFGREDAIEIYHAGYIRDPVKHVVKAKNMLVDVFGLGMDERIGDKFDWSKFPFQGDDIVPVPGPLPIYIREWCAE